MGFLLLKSRIAAILCVISLFFFGAAGIAHAASSPDGAIVEARIVKFIKEIYPGDNVKIRLNAIPAQLRGKVKIVTVSYARVPDMNGDGICSVEIESAPGKSRNVQVPFKVFTKREIFILKQAAQKGEIVGPKDVVTRETYTHGKTQGYPVSLADVVGKALKRDVPGNTILTDQVLEDRVVVKKGDIITIVAESNKLIVHAKGRSVDKGSIGDIIRVKNIASGKELLAKVVSSTSVKVEFQETMR